jgi:hypothetical protein
MIEAAVLLHQDDHMFDIHQRAVATVGIYRQRALDRPEQREPGAGPGEQAAAANLNHARGVPADTA